MAPATTTSGPTPLESCRAALGVALDTGTFKLPVLPQVAGQIMSLTGNPDADIGELSTLIHRDQALASHVLRVANSAAYGGNQAIVSLQQAVTRLGMKLVGEIALAISLHGEVFRVPGFDKQIALMWRHALASGAWGKEIARMKRLNVEGQFLCGLLHTIGKPVVLQAIGELQRERGQKLAHDTVLGLVEEFHCPFGAVIADKWNLPQQVRAACRHYRDFTGTAACRYEVTMTNLADRLATWLVEPERLPEPPAVGDAALTELNLYPDERDRLLERRETVLATVSALDL